MHILKFGKELTEFNYKDYKPVKLMTNDLNKARNLYFKYFVTKQDGSLDSSYSLQSDSADVMNFECDDNICTHAQAC